MCKVKSVEYQALRLTIDLLQSAADSGNLERSQDSLFSQFVRELKVFSKNIDADMEAHPEEFYFDLFSTAYSMLAKKSPKDKEMYLGLLYNDSVKFLMLVQTNNEEKNSGKRYVAQIDLESSILSSHTQPEQIIEQVSER